MEDKKKILLIDDDADIRFIYSTKLETLGYTTFQADGGVKGVEVAKKEHPDVVLLDVMMPSMNGFQVLEELKKDPATKDTPVIFLTAFGDTTPEGLEYDRKAAMEMGAVYYFKKEADLKELAAKIEEVLGKKQ